MTTAATSLLGLALPVTGELQGTWGTTVNDSITSLLDTAVAGTTTLSTDADVTLTTTTLASNQARQAILLCSGARTALRTITAPAQSKIYTIINATTGGFSVKLVGVGPTTGLTIPNGASAVVAWNGSDFIEIGSSTIGNLTVNGNLTVTGTTTLTGAATLTANPTLSAGTANGVAYLNGSKVVTTGSALTFDGTTFQYTGAANFATSTGNVGIGTNSPGYALDVQKSVATGVLANFQSSNTGATYTGIAFRSAASNAAARNWSLTMNNNAFGDFAIRTSTANGGDPIAAGTDRLVIDSSGNLGLGVTPSANDYTGAMQFKWIGHSITPRAVNNVAFTMNAYHSGGGWKYGNTDVASAYVQGSGNHAWYTAPSGTAGNAISFTQAMTLDASGNLGVGTSSPGAKLDVNGGTNSEMRLTTSGSGYLQVGQFTNGAFIGTSSTDATAGLLRLGTGGTTRATIDSSGNLGLGVTPSAWGSSNALQVGSWASLSSANAYGTGIGFNNFYNGTNHIYSFSNAATKLELGAGVFKFFTAPSGTAGNAISFTQAMTLDASGNLGVGTTSPRNAGAGYNGITLNGTTSGFLDFNTNGTRVLTIFGSGNDAWFSNPIATGALLFGTNNAERARIDSSGNLLVGTTSQPSGSYRFVSSTNGTGANGGALFVSNQATTGNEAFSAWHTATSGDNTFCYFGTEASFTVRGSITYNRAGGLTAYNTTSDYRAKDISGPLTDSGAVIDSVPVYMGKMKGATQERPMFIAHEVPAYARTGEKDAVDADGNPVYQQMDASALVPVLWAELQSLRKRVAQLEGK